MRRSIPIIFAFALSSGAAVAMAEEKLGPPNVGATGGYETESDIRGETSASGSVGGEGAQLPSFSEADRDSSGSIEREEVDAVPGIDFSSADLDGDGRLSETEYEAARSAPGQEPMGETGSVSPGVSGSQEREPEPLNR